MNRFHIIGRLAVIVAGLGGALLGLSAGAVPAAVAGMAPLSHTHGRPVLTIPRPEPPGRNQRPPLPAAPRSELTLAQAPAGLRAAVRRTLGVPAASAGRAVRQAKLTAADGAPGDIFGFSVALSGRTAVVGAPFKNSNNGAAYVFVRSGTTWSQQAKLTIAHGAAGAALGKSVALSGRTVVVGAPFQALGRRITGAAYVFVRSGTTWSRQAKLTAPVHSRVSDDLGWSVAVSGSTAVVGDPRNNSFTGAAFVFVRSGTTWSRQAKLTAAAHGFQQSLGTSVVLSGRTVVAGAPGNGMAFVFVRSGTTWSRQAKLTGPVGSFGFSAALSGGTAVVGSPTENSFTGAAYVFTRSGTTWSQQAKLTAADGAADDFFGNSVALSGATAVAGAPGKNSFTGAAYVFTRSGTTWSQRAKLTAAHGAANDSFGNSVALSGRTAVVGAPFKNANAGTAYVFVKV
jgi:hypothetical protein